MGNHERRVAGTVRGTSRPAWAQKQTLALLESNEQEDWAAWLADRPLAIETPHAIVTHARLDPTVGLDDQEERHICAVGGPTVIIERDSDDVPLSFRQTSFAKPICIGHVRYSRVDLVPGRLFSLDSGAVKGGALTAVILPEGKSYRFWLDRIPPRSTGLRNLWVKGRVSRTACDGTNTSSRRNIRITGPRRKVSVNVATVRER